MFKNIALGLMTSLTVASLMVACGPQKKKETKANAKTTTITSDGTELKFEVGAPKLYEDPWGRTAIIDSKILIGGTSYKVVTDVTSDSEHSSSDLDTFTTSGGQTAKVIGKCSVSTCGTFDLMLTLEKNSTITSQTLVRTRDGQIIKVHTMTGSYLTTAKQLEEKLTSLENSNFNVY